MKLLETILLPVEIDNGNTGRTKHFGQAAAKKKAYAAKLMGFKRQPFDHPVFIQVTRILGPRQQQWDYDSILRGSAKELIDCLTDFGWWHDDSPKWIGRCEGNQNANRRDEGPAVEIKIYKP